MFRRSPLNTPAVWPEWYLLNSNTSNSQPVWPGQHKPILQLQSSRELCSACAASPLKGSRCIYRTPYINKALWSPAQTHTHLLCPHMHSRQSSALPHCHRQSITETGLQNNPSSVLRATEIPQDNSWGLLPAAGLIRESRGKTCLQQLLCFYKDEGISKKPANGICVTLELRILSLFWQDRFEAVLLRFMQLLVRSSWK